MLRREAFGSNDVLRVTGIDESAHLFNIFLNLRAVEICLFTLFRLSRINLVVLVVNFYLIKAVFFLLTAIREILFKFTFVRFGSFITVLFRFVFRCSPLSKKRTDQLSLRAIKGDVVLGWVNVMPLRHWSWYDLIAHRYLLVLVFLDYEIIN